MAKIQRYCKYCDGEFMIEKSQLKHEGYGVFCSRKCASRFFGNEQLKSRIECKCQYCEEIFYSKPSRMKIGGKFCSNVCQGKYIIRNNQKASNYFAHNQKIQIKVAMPCSWCGEIFEVIQSRQDKAKFCSRSCQVSFKNTQNTKEKLKSVCKWCKEEFEHYPCTPNKKYCSRSCHISWQNSYNLPKGSTHGKGAWFIKPDGARKYMRSSWEIMFAEFLVELNLDWEYEPRVFRLKNGRGYTPDFYIPSINKWVEIKGYWRDIESREKFQMFKDEYPDCEIELLLGLQAIENFKIFLKKS
jgi:hypothetical protein